jgi:hypothetical protein
MLRLMKWLGKGLLAVVAGIVLFSFGHLFYNTVEFRYRLAVEFDTPEGVKRNASIIKIRRRSPLPFDPFQFYDWKVEGEAVFVDLGSGKNAVMLLAGSAESPQTFWGRAYGLDRAGSQEVWNGKHKDRIKGIVELTKELVPKVVTFTDINDPNSAKLIYETNYRKQCREDKKPYCVDEFIPIHTDEIEATFGPGYAFRRATVEVVPNSTPLTSTIEASLPRLRDPERWNSPLKALPWNTNRLQVGSRSLKRDF